MSESGSLLESPPVRSPVCSPSHSPPHHPTTNPLTQRKKLPAATPLSTVRRRLFNQRLSTSLQGGFSDDIEPVCVSSAFADRPTFVMANEGSSKTGSESWSRGGDSSAAGVGGAGVGLGVGGAAASSSTSGAPERASLSRPSASLPHLAHGSAPKFDLELLVELFMESMKEGNVEEMSKAQQEAAFDTAFNNAVFRRVLRDPQLLAPFQAFLEQQFCAENINFYVAVEKYRKLFDKNTKSAVNERTAMARKIFDRHFASCSMEPVNVDNATSKKIRDLIASETFLKSTFDIAQYQIFHLLKYDCWPRYLRSGGVAPQFTEEEENELRRRLFADEDEEEENGSGGAARQSLEAAQDDTGGTAGVSAGGGDSAPEQRKGLMGTLANLTSTPQGAAGKSKLWAGLDRFSRRLRRGGGSAGSAASSPLSSSRVQRSGSARHAPPTDPPPRRSYSSDMESSDAGARMANSIRRPTTFVCKYCTLMNGESQNEVVALDDPSTSVAMWTAEIAAKHGLDKKATEAVDAQTGATIDPCRQACDALQDRYVRLVPVVCFAIEIISPTFSYKTLTASNMRSALSRVVMLRGRQSLSVSAAIRPLLGRYSLEMEKVALVFSGTCNRVRPSLPIHNIAPRSVVVLSEQQFKERQDVRKELLAREGSFSIELSGEHGLVFHQHGDVAYSELPFDAQINRSSRGDNGIRRLMRRATQAVSSSRGDSRRRSDGPHNPAGVYCGEDMHHDTHHSKKRMSLFKTRSESKGGCTSGSMTERAAEKSMASRVHSSHLSSAPASPAPKTRVEALKAETTPSSAVVVAAAAEAEASANGDAPRTPIIYASAVCADTASTPDQCCGWQPAAYV